MSNYGGNQQQPYSYGSNNQQPQGYGNYQQQYGNQYSQQQQPYTYGANQPYNSYQQQPPPNYNYQQTQPQQQHAHYQPQGSTYYPPTSMDPTTTSSAEKFVKSPKYKDLWAAILYLIVLLGFAVVAYFGVTSVMAELAKDPSNRTFNIPLKGKDIGVLVGLMVGSGFVFTLIYFFLMQKFAGTMIKVLTVVYILGMFALTAFFFISRQLIAGIIFLVITLLYAFFLYSWRKRIPFAKVMLKTVTGIIRVYPSTITSGIIGLILQTGFTALFFVTSLGTVFKYTVTDGKGNTSIPGAAYALYVFLLFTFYWTTQVIKNTVHVTVAGLFATYYFMGVTDSYGKVTVPVNNPTAASAKRALTTSFGSVCYGSLIIAIIQTIRALLRTAAQSAGQDGNIAAQFCLMCVECIISCIEDLVEYFNQYAFTQVAIYGKDYCTAAKATWELVKSKGVDAIINDNLIGIVLTMGGLIVGAAGGGIGYAYYATVIVKDTGIDASQIGYPIAIAVIGFLIAFSEFLILSEVVTSGVSTTFVCLAEDPSALRRTKPELYDRIHAVYPNVAF